MDDDGCHDGEARSEKRPHGGSVQLVRLKPDTTDAAPDVAPVVCGFSRTDVAPVNVAPVVSGSSRTNVAPVNVAPVVSGFSRTNVAPVNVAPVVSGFSRT